jgi:hypothetical protein
MYILTSAYTGMYDAGFNMLVVNFNDGIRDYGWKAWEYTEGGNNILPGSFNGRDLVSFRVKVC